MSTIIQDAPRQAGTFATSHRSVPDPYTAVLTKMRQRTHEFNIYVRQRIKSLSHITEPKERAIYVVDIMRSQLFFRDVLDMNVFKGFCETVVDRIDTMTDNPANQSDEALIRSLHMLRAEYVQLHFNP